MADEFKFPADTPIVSRSWCIERGRAVVIAGERFEDGKRRVIVSQGVSDEDAMRITDVLNEAEIEAARIREKIDALYRMFDKANWGA